jgi:hypothetical protein
VSISEPNDASGAGGDGGARYHVNDVELGVADNLLREEDHIKAWCLNTRTPWLDELMADLS